MIIQKMSEKSEISFRIGEPADNIVRRVIDNSNQYDSRKAFFEQSVENNVRELHSLGAGGTQARTLVRLLNDVRGITATIPEDDSRARIDDQFSKTRPRIELSPTRLDALQRLQLETGLSQSELIRRCIFCQLNRISQQSTLITGWRKDSVRSTWNDVAAGLQRPKLQCYDELTRCFDDERQRTVQRLEKDVQALNRFAEEYTEQFHGSDCYNQLRERRDGRTFTNVENVIEEYTEYTVPQQTVTDGFLEKLTEE